MVLWRSAISPSTSGGPSVGGRCKNDNDCVAMDKTNHAAYCPSSDAIFLKCYKGFCRVGAGQDAGQKCDCLLGCTPYDSSGDFSCKNRVCVRDACTPCGQKQNGLSCCPPGIMSGGSCSCGTLPAGCKNPTIGCPNPNQDCCSDGQCRSKCWLDKLRERQPLDYTFLFLYFWCGLCHSVHSSFVWW